MDPALKQHIIDCEKHLLKVQVRSNPQELDKYIADDFIETGASGRQFGKQEVLERLPTEDCPEFNPSHFACREIAPETILLLYRGSIKATGADNPSLSQRSSIWQRRHNQWQMIFHQGTPCEAF